MRSWSGDPAAVSLKHRDISKPRLCFCQMEKVVVSALWIRHLQRLSGLPWSTYYIQSLRASTCCYLAAFLKLQILLFVSRLNLLTPLLLAEEAKHGLHEAGPELACWPRLLQLPKCVLSWAHYSSTGGAFTPGTVLPLPGMCFTA